MPVLEGCLSRQARLAVLTWKQCHTGALDHIPLSKTGIQQIRFSTSQPVLTTQPVLDSLPAPAESVWYISSPWVEERDPQDKDQARHVAGASAIEPNKKASAKADMKREQLYTAFKPHKSVFVRGIPYYVLPWVVEEKLEAAFSSFGDILNITLETGARPGNYRCACIKFSDINDSKAAVAICKEEPIVIDNAVLQVEFYNPVLQPSRRLYFTPIRVPRRDLYNHLKPFMDQINNIRLIDVEGQRGVLHGFIEFKTVDAAKEALETLDDTMISGCVFHVAFSAWKMRSQNKRMRRSENNAEMAKKQKTLSKSSVDDPEPQPEGPRSGSPEKRKKPKKKQRQSSTSRKWIPAPMLSL